MLDSQAGQTNVQTCVSVNANSKYDRNIVEHIINGNGTCDTNINTMFVWETNLNNTDGISHRWQTLYKQDKQPSF